MCNLIRINGQTPSAILEADCGHLSLPRLKKHSKGRALPFWNGVSCVVHGRPTAFTSATNFYVAAVSRRGPPLAPVNTAFQTAGRVLGGTLHPIRSRH